MVVLLFVPGVVQVLEQVLEQEQELELELELVPGPEEPLQVKVPEQGLLQVQAQAQFPEQS